MNRSHRSLDIELPKLQQGLMEALDGAEDLSTGLQSAFSLISGPVGADFAAFCVSRSSRPNDYDWGVVRLRPEWFQGYAELAPHDLVREAVFQRPNLVLRGPQIASFRQFEQNIWYQRARELGMPVNRVMAVKLDVSPTLHGGFMLYRAARAEFSERERDLLQMVTPLLTDAIRKRRQLGPGFWADDLEWLLGHHRKTGLLLVSPSGRELWRTELATTLIERWFAPHERRDGLPGPLLEQFNAITTSLDPWDVPRSVWSQRSGQNYLKVWFEKLPPRRGRPDCWAWLLEEGSLSIGIPWQWRKQLGPVQKNLLEGWRRHRASSQRGEGLTELEIDVLESFFQGQRYQEIARELSMTDNTVKTHVRNACQKLGVPNREILLVYALLGLPPMPDGDGDQDWDGEG